ncbi:MULTISPECIES: peptidoglycan editing factor PgeF [unclassified Lentilitoribacter]|jgi:YfiH family protein|uniref:peptidoglycan editing factor PgeF n=1 Tax=unclassified Lentilitoribacter TaxID=2647570 RepID=UPI0013A69F13|nr:peptidoglycan editing factor PgeF [Lentilitoribacter sp. Alg239-R112]
MSQSSPQFITSKLITEQGIKHGFFTRRGGHSDGIFSSLNAGLGSGDDRDCVEQNRKDICSTLDINIQNLATLHQIHSNRVHTANSGISSDRPQADGIVSNTSGVAIGVVTADCGPVLFSDHKNAVIGAAHAGWRGALDGVLENTIIEMEKLGAERSSITACLGPTISQQNYEVGPEFYSRFIEKNKQLSVYFKQADKPGHFLYDLHAFIVNCLEQSNVHAEDLGICTYEEDENYFSYRRTTHRNEKDYGRQLSLIKLD